MRTKLPIAFLAVLHCAAPPARPPVAAPEPAPAPAPPPVATPAPAPAPQPAPPPPPPAETPRAPAAEPTRLAWVNPARCLASCDHDPSETLVRVDDSGVAAEQGTHQVDGSVQPALRDLVAAARAAGHNVRVASGYRSYKEQAKLFRTMKQIGRAARPGHSEHQLGTAIDLRLPTTAAIDWLAENAAAHGFALSYPEGKQRITGYRPEPWHVRYVGRSVAEEVRKNRWTLEELFRARPDQGESGSCEDCPAKSSHAPCGKVTAEGSCRGTVLRWCYDGALATVDCAASQQRCGRVEGTRTFDCQ